MCIRDRRYFSPRIYSTGGERYPVNIFKTFLARRLPDMMKPDSKLLLAKTFFFSTFFLDRNLKVKNMNSCVIRAIERRFFSFPLSKKINRASCGFVETTKTSLPCSPAVHQSVSWISRANSVPPRILLSRIPRK